MIWSPQNLRVGCRELHSFDGDVGPKSVFASKREAGDSRPVCLGRQLGCEIVTPSTVPKSAFLLPLRPPYQIAQVNRSGEKRHPESEFQAFCRWTGQQVSLENRGKPAPQRVTGPGGERDTLWNWRRGWDSNPRYGCPYSGFRDRPNRPLWHPSGLRADTVAGPVSQPRCAAAWRHLRLSGPAAAFAS